MHHIRVLRRLFSTVLITAAVVPWPRLGLAAAADLEQRVRYEDRIQRAYRERRVEVAPSKSSTTEEPRSMEALRAKVEQHLRMADALDKVWGQTISADDLQAEYDRILAHSTDPEMLNRLLEALDRDPVAVAAGLVEPIVVRRAVHGAFWWDDAIHGDLRASAEAQVLSADDRGRLGWFTGARAEMEVRLAERQGPEADTYEDGVYVRSVDPGEWARIVDELGTGFGIDHATADSLPLFRPTSVEETKESFSASIILERDADHIRLESLTWWKQTFSDWWNDNEQRFSAEASRQVEPIRLQRRSKQKDTGPAPAKDTWRTTDEWFPMNSDDPDIPEARVRHTVIWTGTQMIVWGGRRGTNFFNSGGIYDPATDSWTATSQGTNCPGSRVNHTANLAAAKMLIWGGWRGTDDSNRANGGIYDPVTDTWEEIPACPILGMERHDHGAFDYLQDYPLYIWGGEDELGYWGAMNDGLIYDPISGTYSDWNLANQPSEREQFVAVVDYAFGNFFVWGGLTRDDYLNTGGLYNLAAGTWSATPTDDAPVGRIGATAVESGGVCTPSPLIVVWGGYNPNQLPQELDSGGYFSPLANDWIGPTPGGDYLPNARDEHTAVMDPVNDRMIIWGGDAATNTGGILDLCTDTWTDVDDIWDPDLPWERRLHTAVWTGTTMLVWGGANDGGGGFLNDGGIYTYCWNDPSTTQVPTVEDEDPCTAGGIRISWSDSLDWGDYDVHRRVAILRDGEVIAEDLFASDLSYLDTTAVQDQSYDYQVQFFNSCDADVTTSSVAGVDRVSASPTPSAAPTAEDTDGCAVASGIDVSWPVDPDDWGDNGADGRKYRVWRYQDPVNGWIALGDQIDYPTATFSDPSPVLGKYRVKYINGCGDTADSPETPIVYDLGGSAPTVTQAVSAEDADGCTFTGNRITWPADPDDWGDNEDGDRFYRVRRSTDGVNFNPIGTNIAYPATSWVDAGAAADQTYYYQVRYKNGCGLETDSPADTATDVDGDAPVAGFNAAAEDPDTCDDGGVVITWDQDAASWGDHDSGARTYDVLRNEVAIQTGLAYGTTTYTDNTGAAGVAYTYRIRFVNGCGLTGPSGVSDPTADEPGIPVVAGGTNNTAADNDDCADTGVLITWDADPGGGWNDDGSGTRTYQVLRDGTPIQTDIPVGTTEFTDSTGETDTDYLYTVRYVNCGGLFAETAGSTAADTVGGTPAITVNSTAADSDTCVDAGITVSWDQDPDDWNDSGSGTRTYDVLRDGTPVQSAIAYGTTTFVDATGVNGTSYTYTVRYNNSCGYSGATSGATGNDRPIVPDGPANNNTASDIDACAATGVLITWDADVDGNWGDGGGVHTYTVLRNGVPVASDLAFGTTSFTDTTGEPNTQYLYTVRYVNCGGLFFETTGFTMTDVAAPEIPANPTVVDASACDQDGVWVSWAPSPGATRYDLRVDGFTEITDVASPYLFDPTDPASHTYEVRASNDACTGDWSQPIAFADLADPESLFCAGFRFGDTSEWDATVP